MRKKELEKRLLKLESRLLKLENVILESEKTIETLKFAGNFDLTKTEVVKNTVFCLGHPIHPPCENAWFIRYIDKNNHVSSTNFALCSNYPSKPEIVKSDKNSAIIKAIRCGDHAYDYEWYQLDKSTGVIIQIPKPLFAELEESVVVEE